MQYSDYQLDSYYGSADPQNAHPCRVCDELTTNKDLCDDCQVIADDSYEPPEEWEL